MVTALHLVVGFEAPSLQFQPHGPWFPSLDPIRSTWLASSLPQNVTHSKLSPPGYRPVTYISAVLEHKRWCHGVMNALIMVILLWSDVHHLLPLCRVCITIRINVFGMRVRVTVPLESPFILEAGNQIGSMDCYGNSQNICPNTNILHRLNRGWYSWHLKYDH